ncbi:TonB-dependent siderophore receptor [Thalassospira alkalitolerans]|uniref:TonB-dependent siderophore receptor n=1 Tax=Thalassospira alkalitolerans TaxID=1293890 RepID=UPI0030EF07FB|tara:strand:- start:33850 stop:36063 length:2214 start_codon:yes stop_codon:yes gene_type:complete
MNMTTNSKVEIARLTVRQRSGMNRFFCHALMTGVSMLALSHVAMAQEATTEDEIVLDPITVEDSQTAEKGDGPVKGYVAKRSRSATKTDTPIEKTPQSISVIPADQIEDQAAGSVAEALRYTPGVVTEYRGTSNLHDEMYVRGFSYVPKYLDGLTYGEASFGQIEPYLLERVELLRGPSSILYGQANPGGVVNQTTKRPTGETSNEVELSVGTNNLYSTAGDFSGVISKEEGLSYRLVAKGITEEEVAGDIEKNRIAIMPSINWTPNLDTSLTVTAIYQNDPDAGTRGFLSAEGTLYPTENGYFPRDFYVGAYDWEESSRTQASFGYQLEHAVDETLTLRQNARYNHIEADFKSVILDNFTSAGAQVTRAAVQSGDEFDQYVIDNQAQLDLETGDFDHTVLFGVDYKYSTKDSWFGRKSLGDENWQNLSRYTGLTQLGRTSTDQHAEAWQAGVYAQDQVEFGKWNVSFGGRHDWANSDVDNYLKSTKTSQDDQAFSGRVGAVYSFDNGIAPYASYSTSFEPKVGVDQNGDAYDPVTAQQYEAGVRYAPDHGGYMITASVYQLTQQNIVSTDPADSSKTYQTGEIESRGFEIEGRANVTKNLSMIASYARINAKTVEDENPANVGLKTSNTPRDQAALWAKYTFDQGVFDGVAIGGGVRYTGVSFDRKNTTKVPDYMLFDAMLSYDLGAVSSRLDGASVQLNAVNLSDETYVSSCTVGAWACWYGPGRAVTATLKYNW